MKNLYLFFLLTPSILLLSPSNFLQAFPAPAKALLITDQVALYGHELDSVYHFVERLTQAQGLQLDADYSARSLDHLAWLSTYELIIFVGEKSLFSLSQEQQSRIEEFLESKGSQKVPAILGLFFQEDRNQHRDIGWNWYEKIKTDMSASQKKTDVFPLPFHAIERKDLDPQSALPVAYKHSFSRGDLEDQANRIYISYLADDGYTFSGANYLEQADTYHIRHYEGAILWLLGKADAPEESMDILRLEKKQEGLQVELSWNDFLASENCEYQVQKSLDGKTWSSIHKQKGNEDPQYVYVFKEEELAPGNYLYRIFRKEDKQEDVYSGTILLAVHDPGPAFVLFPNPASKVVHVDLSQSPGTDTEIRLQGPVFGSRVLKQDELDLAVSGHSMAISLENMIPGLYHIQVKTAKSTTWKTFLKVN